jgi:hypothetical protein
MSEDSERMNTPCPQAAVATIMLPWTATSSLDRHWIPFPDRAKPDDLVRLIRAEKAHPVAEALTHDAAVDDEIFRARFHLHAVGLLVRLCQPRAVAVDDKVLEDDTAAVVPQDEDVPITRCGRRVDQLDDGFGPFAKDDESCTLFRSSDHRPPGTVTRETRYVPGGNTIPPLSLATASSIAF